MLVKYITIDILKTRQSIDRPSKSLYIKPIYKWRSLTHDLFNNTVRFFALYNADWSDFRNKEDPGTIIDTLTNLPVNYSKSFTEHFLLVIKFLIKAIDYKPLFSGNEIYRDLELTIQPSIFLILASILSPLSFLIDRARFQSKLFSRLDVTLLKKRSKVFVMMLKHNVASCYLFLTLSMQIFI